MKKTEAIKNFLKIKAPQDLATLYNSNMEVQVNVAKDYGERFQGEYQGKRFTAWTDGIQTWKDFRIPWNAKKDPHYEDSDIKFDLAEHCEGIGLTGWDWKNKQSIYVAFDFDALLGHSESHQKKLNEHELKEVRDRACKIPWVTVRRSTSGNGLHLYVYINSVDTNNHSEHSALARAILAKMSAIAGFDFNSKVDNCGGIIWIWHRKFDKSNGLGLKLIKQGSILNDIPINWKDHLSVTSGNRTKNKPKFVKDPDWFDELCGQHPKIRLDDQHRALLDQLEKQGACWWWDSDHHMLVCHTYDLKIAGETLGTRGIFDTLATGKEQGQDINCFAFPMSRGAWVVRRYTPGVTERDCWDQDASGWTRCYFNREPNLAIAAKAHGGIEDEDGSFAFQEAEIAAEAAKSLGSIVDIPPYFLLRNTALKAHKDGRLIMKIESTKDDPPKMKGWIKKKGKWVRVLDTKTPTKYEPEIGNHDDVIRHLLTPNGEDAGWVIAAEDGWSNEPINHVRLGLKSLGYSPQEIELILGKAVMKRWTLVNEPFGPEYPGDRKWNRDAAQFSVAPSQHDDLKYDTWMQVLNHCGKNLDLTKNQWCKDNGIITGGEYLKLWIASMFQKPFEPLPYLFFYGPQGSGKSIFHESINLLITKGVVPADTALLSQAGFNAELQSAILCYIEETDLRTNKSQAYNRIKDWTTGQTLNIHVKGLTPYTVRNTTHWVQMSNDVEECPIFPGDTRITMIYVSELENPIAKRELINKLRKESSDFLAAILRMEIPYVNDRLGIPVLDTSDKQIAEKANQNDFEAFLSDQCFYVPGSMIKWSVLYDRFKEWLDPERRPLWTKRKTGRHLPPEYPKGRNMKDGAQLYVGNINFEDGEPNRKIILSGDTLVQTHNK